MEEGVAFLGFEMDPHYAELGQRRIDEATPCGAGASGGGEAQLSLV